MLSRRDRLELQREIGALRSRELRSNLRAVEVERLRYRVGRETYVGYIAMPRGRRRATLPLVIVNRGGNHQFGTLAPGWIFGRMSTIASWGYVVIATQYPGVEGGEGTHRFGSTDLRSVLALRRVAGLVTGVSYPTAGMYGFSRGSMMTFLAMREVRWIRAAVCVGTLSDLRLSMRMRPEMRGVYRRYFKITPREIDRRSAVKFARSLRSKAPLLLLHGGRDAACHPEQVLGLARAHGA